MVMKKYKGSKKLTWTDEAIEAFHFCRVAVSNCQELYFLEDTETPILQTDASDYGIGGYLYMIVNRVYAQTHFCAFDLRFRTVVRGKRSFDMRSQTTNSLETANMICSICVPCSFVIINVLFRFNRI